MEMEDHGSPCLSLQVAGKHALLFDDDSTAAFINSEDALLPWNGQTQGGRDQSLKLMIDRYDVRHLLEDLSASALRKRKRKHPHDVNQIEADLDLERYRDLHHHSPDHNGRQSIFDFILPFFGEETIKEAEVNRRTSKCSFFIWHRGDRCSWWESRGRNEGL